MDSQICLSPHTVTFLTSTYTEPIFTSFFDQENYALVAIDFTWSDLKIYFYELNGKKKLKMKVFEIRSISVMSTLNPETSYSVTNCFSTSLEKSELLVINEEKLTLLLLLLL